MPNVFPRFLKRGTGGGGPGVDPNLVPGVTAISIEPSVMTTDREPPEFELLSVDPSPVADVSGADSPSFEVSPVITPKPSADTKVDSETPEVLISPVVDLKPRIIDGDD